MKLKEICEIADSWGLETIGQAMMYAELHYDALMLIDDVDKEFEELYREAEALGPEWESISIYTIIKKAEKNNQKDGGQDDRDKDGYLLLKRRDKSKKHDSMSITSKKG